MFTAARKLLKRLPRTLTFPKLYDCVARKDAKYLSGHLAHQFFQEVAVTPRLKAAVLV